MAKVSIITICLNAAKELERTINSVLGQDFQDFEYIIQDGKSTDSTLQVIQHYADEFKGRNIPFKFFSQKDGGIYDAMNKAVNMVEGEWVLYLNAGDKFFDNGVLRDVFKQKYVDSTEVIYGHTLIELTTKNFTFVAVHDKDLIEDSMSLSHQSMFVKKELLQKYPFECTYKIAADYDFCLKLYREKVCFQRVNVIISRYSREGISSKYTGDLREERASIQEKYQIKKGKKKRVFLQKILNKITIAFPILSDIKYCMNQMKRMAITFKEDV